MYGVTRFSDEYIRITEVNKWFLLVGLVCLLARI